MRTATSYPKITTANPKYKYVVVAVYNADGDHPKGWYGKTAFSSSLESAERTAAWWSNNHTERDKIDFVVTTI